MYIRYVLRDIERERIVEKYFSLDEFENINMQKRYPKKRFRIMSKGFISNEDMDLVFYQSTLHEITDAVHEMYQKGYDLVSLIEDAKEILPAKPKISYKKEVIRWKVS